ncbi:MAG: transglycosylase domain-containing protein [Burkholderiaceae bacterium]|nr:transglycosylase domain-containing protein [Burkholderiaceae bacterium]
MPRRRRRRALDRQRRGRAKLDRARRARALAAKGAVVAAEDQRFHEHAGIDRIELDALLADIDAEKALRGASTVSQQLARTLVTGGERTVARKIREALYAVEMERTLGKPRILELYLNTVDWGPGICGARAAARAYFRKAPSKLTPLEAAWLAGILRNPQEAYAREFSRGAPELERALWVLSQMRTLPKRERERWSRRPLVFAPDRNAGATPRALAAR